jgi:hypothetical protein
MHLLWISHQAVKHDLMKGNIRMTFKVDPARLGSLDFISKERVTGALIVAKV